MIKNVTFIVSYLLKVFLDIKVNITSDMLVRISMTQEMFSYVAHQMLARKIKVHWLGYFVKHNNRYFLHTYKCRYL